MSGRSSDRCGDLAIDKNASPASAAATYRASGRARSRAEFVAKLGVVHEESDEAVYWLELMRDSNVGDRRQVGLLLPEAREFRAIFAASYRTARRGRKAGGAQINR